MAHQAIDVLVVAALIEQSVCRWPPSAAAAPASITGLRQIELVDDDDRGRMARAGLKAASS
jgi:hypothetical protein